MKSKAGIDAGCSAEEEGGSDDLESGDRRVPVDAGRPCYRGEVGTVLETVLETVKVRPVESLKSTDHLERTQFTLSQHRYWPWLLPWACIQRRCAR